MYAQSCSANVMKYFNSTSGIPGHGPSTIPVSIPGDQFTIQHQASSSLSSGNAEVAELAGCSLEDSTELKRRAEAQQTVADTTTEETNNRDSSDDSPSTEEDVDGQGK